MEIPPNPLLESLVQINKVDAALARVLAEKKRLEKEGGELSQRCSKVSADYDRNSKAAKERRARIDREEKEIRGEEEKLVNRRKELATLGSYKVQQAGMREIEGASHAIEQREEALIGSMTEVEALERNVAQQAEELKVLQGKLEEFKKDAVATLKNLEERERGYLAERKELVARVNQRDLAVYDRLKERFPMDAIVPMVKGNCGGCRMQLGPQFAVQISRGKELIRCRGCGRILYLTPESVSGDSPATSA